MKRLNFMVPEDLYDWLYEESERKDISAAEIMRRALSAWKNLRSDPLIQFEERHLSGPEQDQLRSSDADVETYASLLRTISNQLQLLIAGQPDDVRERMIARAKKHPSIFKGAELPDDT